MAYEKQNFVDGNVLTADNLNHMEEGIAAAAPAGYVEGVTSTANQIQFGWAYQGKFNEMADNTISFIRIYLNAQTAEVPMGEWVAMITRVDSKTGFVRIDSPNHSMVNTITDGVWGTFTNCSPSAFAPAGYGLGANVARLRDYTLLDINSNGFYGIDGSVGEKVPVDENYFWYSNMLKMGAFQLLHGTISNAMVIRNNFTGAEEWVNPPMAPGVEYRTTERWNGKVVWTQLIDYGALPNNAQKAKSCATFTQLCESCFTVTDGTNYSDANKEPWITGFSVSSGTILLKTNIDVSAYTATVQLWYVKD